MKKIILLAILTFCLYSCKKDSIVAAPSTWIVGNWTRVAATSSVYSLEVQIVFNADNTGYGLNVDNVKSNFTYSLTTFSLTNSINTTWQINKISDTQLSIGTPGVTVLTYYTKQ